MSSERAPIWRYFWAKTDRSGERPEWTRPLWAHLIDVACVAELLWKDVVSSHTRRRLAAAIELDEAEAGRWYSMLIGMHDIGKAIPSFQSMHSPSHEKLIEVGLPFKRDGYGRGERLHHGHASIPTLIDWLGSGSTSSEWSRAVVEAICAGIGFHHGKLETRGSWEHGRLRNSDLTGMGAWGQERLSLLNAVAEVWRPHTPGTIRGPRRAWPTWFLELCGWCTLADWLGSMEEVFPDVAHDSDMESYLSSSRRAAQHALRRAGMHYQAGLNLSSFGEVFVDDEGKPRVPRPLQLACAEKIALDRQSEESSLTIIEAPTGEGKTEAAFYLALRQQSGGRDGIYVAMPSQATSNGLFARFEEFLSRSHQIAAGPINLLLVHGMSGLHSRQQELVNAFINARRSIASIYDDETDQTTNARVRSATWFLPKKRSLLAPYGIGTVDQVLLGIVYSRHFFLRLYGLAGKTVIFDEVHAYDTYMNGLFLRLLEWLREVGSHVIVLSATLPEATRRSILERWSETSPESAGNNAPYPAIWHTRGSQPTSPLTFEAQQGQKATIQMASTEPSDIAHTVADALGRGAAVGVILNTVSRAQQVYRAISELVSISPDDFILFHARFPHEHRSEIERRVLQRFGPQREPGKPAVLVATQVAEQSLDFDVDYMLSDLAPIDLLLQRAGRLHRHCAHHKDKRPEDFTSPVLTVLIKAVEDGSLPDVTEVSGHGHVYPSGILYRTYRLLRARSGWSLPSDYRALIEGVYGEDRGSAPVDLNEHALSAWNQAENALRNQWMVESHEVNRRIIPPPKQIRGLAEISEQEQIDPEAAPPDTHPAYLAVTRLGGPSYPIVCLHRRADGRVFLDTGYSEPLPSIEELDRAVKDNNVAWSLNLSQRLIECSLSLSGHTVRAAVEYLGNEEWTALRERLPAVRFHEAIIFEDLHWHSQDGRHHYEYNIDEGIIRHSNKSED